jgi:hypothetical protein
MQHIIKDIPLKLIHQPGKGAWTYHLRIPNSKNIAGKWGDIKVSGTIDNFTIENRNLAPIKGEDKMLSINSEIRKAINKKGGEVVMVTLYLDTKAETITKGDIIETFNQSNVLVTFQKLDIKEQDSILNSILSVSNEDRQVRLIVKQIEKLGKLL